MPKLPALLVALVRSMPSDSTPPRLADDGAAELAEVFFTVTP